MRNAAVRADEAPRTHDAAPFGRLIVNLAVEDEAWEGEGLGDVEALALACLRATMDGAGMAPDLECELGLTLSDDERVQVLNAQWRGKDKPTNVLSFPMADLDPGDRPGPMLGDLVLARQTLRREAMLEDKTLRDHLCHLIVHGVLHCLGHDHVEPGDAEAMEALEVRILASLGIPDPYSMSEPEEEPSRA